MASTRTLLGTLGNEVTETTNLIYVMAAESEQAPREDFLFQIGDNEVFSVSYEDEGSGWLAYRTALDGEGKHDIVSGVYAGPYAVGTPVYEFVSLQAWYDPSEFWDDRGEPRGLQPEFDPPSSKPSPHHLLPYRDQETDTEGQAAYERMASLVEGVNRIAQLVAEANGG